MLPCLLLKLADDGSMQGCDCEGQCSVSKLQLQLDKMAAHSSFNREKALHQDSVISAAAVCNYDNPILFEDIFLWLSFSIYHFDYDVSKLTVTKNNLKLLSSSCNKTAFSIITNAILLFVE